MGWSVGIDNAVRPRACAVQQEVPPFDRQTKPKGSRHSPRNIDTRQITLSTTNGSNSALPIRKRFDIILHMFGVRNSGGETWMSRFEANYTSNGNDWLFRAFIRALAMASWTFAAFIVQTFAILVLAAVFYNFHKPYHVHSESANNAGGWLIVSIPIIFCDYRGVEI